MTPALAGTNSEGAMRTQGFHQARLSAATCRNPTAWSRQTRSPLRSERPNTEKRSNGDARRRAVRRVGLRSRPTWRCQIGSETRTLRNPDGARVSNPIRQRASLRDARRTALRVPPFLRVSVFGRYLCMLRCLIRPGALDGVRGTVRYPDAFGL